MKKQLNQASNTIVYQSKNGAIALKTDAEQETIWLTQEQMTTLFDVQKAAISKHLKNIFVSEELQEKAVVSILETTAKDNKVYKIKHFNLDAVLSVGYRVNSKKATHFRQWATKTLKAHIQQGYTINRQRIKSNYDNFLQAVADVKTLLGSGTSIDNDTVLELVTLFADTWVSLDAYDKDQLNITGATKKKVVLTTNELTSALHELKASLVVKGEATNLFGKERVQDAVASIIGNVMQSFAEEDVYPTVEEKAAHLLYFIVKNHPFVDGNKRSGAYAFIWFLKYTKLLDVTCITPPALTALTLLIAESAPGDKNKMIGLVCAILKK
ncbi:MAG: death-on-curing protein [Gammaproteobacteria bacterium RIFCSPHIGHO2_12_FULL_41_15]|nr:MAG: death-on-curing protein [Gammaproteobacteria bacterium RIFCSPHIGHO2_12_FULL_41_15]